jgi:hypothetical protein
MVFRVRYKGIQEFKGNLALAYAYLEKHWGSATQAYRLGVKLEAVL